MSSSCCIYWTLVQVCFGSGACVACDRSEERQDGLAVERLPQERRTPGLLRVLANGIGSVPGYDDDRHVAPVRPELSLQIDAGHAGHLDVHDEEKPLPIRRRRDKRPALSNSSGSAVRQQQSRRKAREAASSSMTPRLRLPCVHHRRSVLRFVARGALLSVGSGCGAPASIPRSTASRASPATEPTSACAGRSPGAA